MQQRANTWIQPEEMADSVLISQSLAGNQRAFESLIRRYYMPLQHCISTYLRDQDEACDVLQQVLVQLFRSLPTLEREVAIKSWLLRVAHNRCIDELRKKRRRPATLFSELEKDYDEDASPLAAIADRQPLPEECAEYHDLMGFLDRSIRRLSPATQTVVLLHCREGLSFSQIGQQLHMREGAVRGCFYRARIRLLGMLSTR